MKRYRSARDVWASLLPTAGGALALAAASNWPALALPGGLTGPGLLLVLVLSGAAAACHRPLGGATLGLGAVVLPPALYLSGALPAACLAAACFLVAELLHRLVRRNTAVQLPERRRLLRSLESTGRAALATLGGGLVWAALGRDALLAGPAAGLGVYLALWIGLEVADRKIRRPDAALRWRPVLPSLTLDATAWVAGTAATVAGRGAGWAAGGLLVAAVGAVALEAARNALLHELALRRIDDLERVRKSAANLMQTGQGMAAVAEQIRSECQMVLPFHWFQFELLARGGEGSETKSWWAGPRTGIAEGVPRPDRFPPALPGVHRRSPWQILEYPLRADGHLVARLRLWCDPRRLHPEDQQLLERLLPQMGASVQRSLLDREASEDPLTGVAVRRVLERRLQEVHARCVEEGGSMAVVMCDLDHFKRINDTYGHGVGDEALVAVAGVLNSHRREGDLCCRYGGEEFTLLLEGTEGETALAIAERLRQRVEGLEFVVEESRVPLALSAGVAAFPQLYVKAAGELLLFADGALYEAKRRGRNRCLLDLGQGRYQAPDGTVERAKDGRPIPEPPRIFA